MLTLLGMVMYFAVQNESPWLKCLPSCEKSIVSYIIDYNMDNGKDEIFSKKSLVTASRAC